MWQMKRRPSGRFLSSFLALLLVITTVLNPLCSVPTYATESKVRLSYDYVSEKGEFVEPGDAEAKDELVALLSVDIHESEVLEAGKSYQMTLTLELDENEEWVKTITTSSPSSTSPSNATPANASPSNVTTRIEELLSNIRYELTTYGAEFKNVRIKNVDLDYDNYEANVDVAFTVDAETEAGEYFGKIEAVVNLKGEDDQNVSQGFSFEVEAAAALTEEELAEIQNVIEMIEELPTIGEFLEDTEEFYPEDGEEDEKGYYAYIAELAKKVLPVYEAYMALSPKLQEMIPMEAIDKLIFLYERYADAKEFNLQDLDAPNSDLPVKKNEDIKIHLFNYGAYINEAAVNGGNPLLGFSNDTSTTTDTKKKTRTIENKSARDVTLTKKSAYKPAMLPVLVDGYPYVTQADINATGTKPEENADPFIWGEGSLKFYFDTDNKYENGFDNGSTYLGNNYSPIDSYDPTQPNGSNYVRKHFAVDNTKDGYGLFWAGTGDDEGYIVFDSAYHRAEYVESENAFALYDYALRPYWGSVNLRGQGHFLPFNYDLEEVIRVTNEYGEIVANGDELEAAHLEDDSDDSDENHETHVHKSTCYGADKKVICGNVTTTELETMLQYKTENPKLSILANNLYVLPNAAPDGAVTQPSVDDEYTTTTYALTPENRSKAADYYYGMSIEFDFYMPEDGKVDDEAMIFDFLGDDDVWVYIDDVLVLNIGGAHNPMIGNIDFSTGVTKQPDPKDKETSQADENLESSTLKAIYTAAKDIKGNRKYSDADIEKMFDGDTFADYTSHTLKFFYMERGSGSANCRLRFNIPTLPSNALQVKKEVEENENVLLADKDYFFRVVAYDQNGEKVVLSKNAEYTILGKDEPLETGEDGVFSIKAGETAVLPEMMDKTEEYDWNYYVEEIIPNNEKPWYSEISYTVSADNKGVYTPVDTTGVVDGDSTVYSTGVISAEDGATVVYTNDPMLGDLKIEKTVAGLRDEDAEDYEIHIAIDGVYTDSNCTLKDFTKIGDVYTASMTIKDLLVGTYKVTERVDEDVETALAVEYSDPETIAGDGLRAAKRMWTNVNVADGEEATANFENTYALRSLEISKALSTEKEYFVDEANLPAGTKFTFKLKSSENDKAVNIGKFRYEIIGDRKAVKFDGESIEDAHVVRAADSTHPNVYEMDINKSEIEITFEKFEEKELPFIKIVKIPEGRNYTVEELAYKEEGKFIPVHSSKLSDIKKDGVSTNDDESTMPIGAITWPTFSWNDSTSENTVEFINDFQWNAEITVKKVVNDKLNVPEDKLEREFMIQIEREGTEGTYVDTAAVLKHGETSGVIRVDKPTTLIITETKVKEFTMDEILVTKTKLGVDGAKPESVDVENNRKVIIEPGYSYEIWVLNNYGEEPYFHDDNGKMNVVGIEDGKAVPQNPETKTSPTTVAMMIESRFLNRKEDEFEAQDDTTAVV